MEEKKLKFMILVVAYNAITTLVKVLDRIPKDVWNEVGEVVVFDDCSSDETTLLAKGYKESRKLEKLSIYRNERNLGYGGNQKKGYEYAISKGYDYVILLHGDGQYAPEVLGDFIKVAKEKEPAMVSGSRMLNRKRALKGGMPYYKFLGNIILTTYQNLMLHSKLSEFHSGYRMYKTEVLKNLHLDKYTDDFHFDTQIMVEILHRHGEIVEIPIPTYYGGEVCYVNGMKYAFNVFKSVLQYKLFTLGLTNCDWVEPLSRTKYSPKKSPLSSHKRVAFFVPRNATVLDLGSEGNYIEELKEKQCNVVGITLSSLPDEVKGKYDEVFIEDLDKEKWKEFIQGKKFDAIILADVVEHLKEPVKLISLLKDFLKNDGIVIASTPNIAHLYIRLCLLFGKFPYSKRGILDETHLHFYTKKSFKKLFENEGYLFVKRRFTPIPFELFSGKSKFTKLLTQIVEYSYYLFVKISPSLFAYQMVYVFRKK